MKAIAIFCDGTWQHLDQRYPTNVAKLARAVAPASAAGPQFVYYDDGVGVSSGVADNLTHLVGGATGQGLDYKIARAYEFLCLNYEPGDRIFIFGFSRGAYTARSLAGLLRLAWILKREEASRVFEVAAFYRTRPKSTAPQADRDAFDAIMAKYRADHCYPDPPFLADQAYVPGDPSSLTPEAGCAWIQHVGVWDTVGSLGVPANLPFARELDAKYDFNDTDLSRFVRSARHAVSIDERRDTFAPTLWDNIDTLNKNAHADGFAYADRPYQQVWFPGGHGCVGGGGDDGGISIPPLLWIAEGARRAGLALDEPQLALYARQAHPDARFEGGGFSVGDFLISLDGLSDRKGPDVFDEVSQSARDRWVALPSYRPSPLRRSPDVLAGLEALAPVD